MPWNQAQPLFCNFFCCLKTRTLSTACIWHMVWRWTPIYTWCVLRNIRPAILLLFFSDYSGHIRWNRGFVSDDFARLFSTQIIDKFLRKIWLKDNPIVRFHIPISNRTQSRLLADKLLDNAIRKISPDLEISMTMVFLKQRSFIFDDSRLSVIILPFIVMHPILLYILSALVSMLNNSQWAYIQIPVI